MANSTKTVCSTVGPFINYGSTLVGVCALSGTNYVDSTGEIAWVRHMIKLYDNDAVANRAKLMSCCGFDCIPYDLNVYKCWKEL